MKKSNFIYASILLAFINFIVRSVGFLYKIILSKLIGPEGIGLFQIVMPVLMIFLTITTAGLPIAISRLVSKENSRSNFEGIKRIFYSSLLVTLVLSFILSLILYKFSLYISIKIFKNKNTFVLINMLCPAIVIISLSSVVRGFYYGLKKINIAGIALILEQITRILFVIGIIYYLKKVNPYYGAYIAIIGISVGEFFGLLWLILNIKFNNQSNKRKNLSIINILYQLFTISFPITISRIINVSLQLSNAIIIPQRLIFSGISKNEAISTYGRVTGMAMPFIFLPFIVTSALVVNIIPNISEKIELKLYSSIREDILTSFKITFIISIPITIIYAFYSKEISTFFYRDYLVGKYLSIMSISVVFHSLYHTLSGILHGLGKQVTATLNFTISMLIQITLTYILVGNKNFGINGYFIGFIIGSIILFILNYITLKKSFYVNFDFSNWLLKPLFSSIIMILTISFFKLFINISNIFIVPIYIIFGFISYLSVLILTNCISPLSVKNLLKRKSKPLSNA